MYIFYSIIVSVSCYCIVSIQPLKTGNRYDIIRHIVVTKRLSVFILLSAKYSNIDLEDLDRLLTLYTETGQYGRLLPHIPSERPSNKTTQNYRSKWDYARSCLFTLTVVSTIGKYPSKDGSDKFHPMNLSDESASNV